MRGIVYFLGGNKLSPLVYFEEMGFGPFFLVTTNTHTLISDVLAANGYELIEAEYAAVRQLWRVFIDRTESRRGVDLITVEDCSTASDLVQDALIAADIPYEHLEVSSPGMDRALTKPTHYERFAGEIIKLTIEPPLKGLRKLVGKLVGFQNEEVVLDIEGIESRIPYTQIVRARVQPQY
ncbi:MAG: ribosome maturation factor RimP [Rhizobacter sp.]|nr:ribosome maturation factor RimP [Burkholderiales bacterium]